MSKAINWNLKKENWRKGWKAKKIDKEKLLRRREIGHYIVAGRKMPMTHIESDAGSRRWTCELNELMITEKSLRGD